MPRGQRRPQVNMQGGYSGRHQTEKEGWKEGGIAVGSWAIRPRRRLAWGLLPEERKMEMAHSTEGQACPKEVLCSSFLWVLPSQDKQA